MAIICGTDLSPASAAALDVAVSFARLLGRGSPDVVLVHVADTDDPAGDPQLRAQVEAQAQTLRGAGAAIRCVVLGGPPAETLVHFAATEHCELLVVAARSRATTLLRLGTTTDAIIANTHVPVLAVRDPAPLLAYARGERALRALIAMDDSAVCELGVQWVHGMRNRAAIDVALGAIYYPDDATDKYGLEYKSALDRDPELERLIERDLLRRFGRGGNGDIAAYPRRGLGRLGDHVVELARERGSDVIVVGTSQKTGLGRLGSVSSIIVNDAPQSVICIPPDASIPTVTVPVLRAALVATDLSQFSNRAIPYAFAACEPDAEIHIVHIVDEDDDERLDEAELRRTLAALAPPVTHQRITTHVVRGDDAAKTIAQTAARLGVDVICMCSHGRSGLTRALMGSVADRLLRATRLPVLVLRPS